VDDYNFRPATGSGGWAGDKLICLLAPSSGGQMYELDVRTICHKPISHTDAAGPRPITRKVLGGREQRPRGA